MTEELKKKIGNKWEIFNKLHQLIMSLDGKITYRIFPIYVSYYFKDNVIAVVYFRGKFISDSQLVAGFALKEKPKDSNFMDAGYMKYKGINYSLEIKNYKDISKKFIGEMGQIIKY